MSREISQDVPDPWEYSKVCPKKFVRIFRSPYPCDRRTYTHTYSLSRFLHNQAVSPAYISPFYVQGTIFCIFGTNSKINFVTITSKNRQGIIYRKHVSTQDYFINNSR